jgi:hypothetical protein
MTSFAIEMGEEKGYSLAALRGGNAQIIDNRAASN